jgi:hypothetical protein
MLHYRVEANAIGFAKEQANESEALNVVFKKNCYSSELMITLALSIVIKESAYSSI